MDWQSFLTQAYQKFKSSCPQNVYKSKTENDVMSVVLNNTEVQ